MAQNPISQYRPYSMLERGSPFHVLQRQMNRLLEDVFGPESGGFPQAPEEMRGVLSPRVELTEGEAEWRVTAELPGVKEQEIEVSLDGDLLTLRAEKKAEKREDKENTHFTERSFGMFQRALRLPFVANPDEVKASLVSGVLTITVPKPKDQEQKRRIEVRGGG